MRGEFSEATPSSPHALQVEEEPLDHVLGDVARHQFNEVLKLDLMGCIDVAARALDRGSQYSRRGWIVACFDLTPKTRRQRGQDRFLRDPTGELVRLPIEGLAYHGVGRDPSMRRGQKVFGRAGKLVDQTQLKGLGRRQGLASEQNLV
jgi:hypothetical protein